MGRRYLRVAGRPWFGVAAMLLVLAGAVRARGEDGSAIVSSRPKQPEGGGAFPLSLGTLPSGKSLTVVFRVTVNDPFFGNQAQVSNQGTVSGGNFAPVVTDDPDTQTASDPTVTPVDLRPDLSIAKSDGGVSAIPGGTIAYTLTYANLSTFGAPNVVLSDVVPPNATFDAGASTAGWVCTPDANPGSLCTLAVGLVGGSSGGTATFAVAVVNPVPAGVAQIANTATIASGLPDPVAANNTSTDTTPVNAQPDLTIGKSDGGATVVPGGTVAYTLSYANAGNQGAMGVALTDVVPANTTFNAGASTAGWSCLPDNNPGSTCTLGIGALAGGGGSGAATYAVTVANRVPAGVSQVSNTASVADDGANGADPSPANNTSTDTTPVVAQPDLSLIKSDGGVGASPGGTVAYLLSFANSGNQGATGVVLTDVVPAHTIFNTGASTAGWACAPNNNAGSTCTLAVGSVAGGSASGAATFAVTVLSPVPAGVTQVSNTASVADDGANGADPTPANNASTDTTPVNATPDLGIVKSDGGASASPGGIVTYTLTYLNFGNQGATGVVLADVVPANATFNPGASTAGWACVPDINAGSSCTLGVPGALPGGGASGAATFAVTVVNPAPAGLTQLSNTATVADDGTNGADPNGANNTSTDTTPVDAQPDLTLAKSDGGASVTPGGTVAYTLSYANAGNQGATGVVLTDVVPANTTFNAGASTAGWACAPNNNAGSSCTLSVGGLAGGGASGSAAYAVTAIDPVPAGVTQISNTASVADDGANGADPTPANNASTDTTPLDAVPNLSITKSDSGVSVTPGGTVTYTLSFANAGNQGATGVALADVVPAHTTFNPGASSAGWTCVPNNDAGSSCTLSVGALGGGGTTGSRTYAVTVVNPVPNGVGQVSNTATVADDGANGPDPNPANNTSTDTTPVVAAPDLALVKSDGGASVNPSGSVLYALGYSNGGNRGATGVTLTDVVPPSTTFAPGFSTAGWTCVPDNNAGSTCTLAVGTLAAGASGAAVFAVTVAGAVPAGYLQVSNTGSVADDGTNGADPNPFNNTASDTTPVIAWPDLAIAKDDGLTQAAPGDAIAYTLTYGNAGNRGASGVVLSDTVPLHTAFAPGASTAGWVCVPDNNAGSVCTLGVGTVQVSATGTATFAVTVLNPVPAGAMSIGNTGTIADDGVNGVDPNLANNTSNDVDFLIAVPDLTIAKSDGGVSVVPGGTVAYTLTYANGGNQGATGVTLTEVVPAHTTFDPGASTAGWTCVPDNNPGSGCSLTIGGLAGGGAGATATFAVTVADTLPAGVDALSNTATVGDDGSNGPDPNPANNTSTDTTPVVAAPDLAVTKSDGGVSVVPGGTVLYTLSYSNVGSQGATGVTLTDVVPLHTRFAAGASTPGWTCVPDTNPGSTCTLVVAGTVAAGGSGAASFAVEVDVALPVGVPEVSNTAGVADDGANGPDPVQGNNNGSDVTPLLLVPDVAAAELTHGFTAVDSLAVVPGPEADIDLYRISQKPHSSYEVVVDATAGDVNEVVLERLAADGSTVLQSSVAVGVGAARSLRFTNDTSAPVDDQFVRVRSGGCGTACGPDTRYRLRAYDTTYNLERFNNGPGQACILLLQNRTDQTVTGTIRYWDAGGNPVGYRAFTLVARELFIMNTAADAPGVSGSVTIASDAPYGMLAGKIVVAEPAAGFTQDVLMKARIR